jgi:hypothetical protein
MDTFPADFSGIANERMDFESVFRASLEENAPAGDVMDLAERFWSLFCYHLRVNNGCYDNIPKETLHVWRSSLSEEREFYNVCLQDQAFDLGLEGKNKTIDTILEKRDERVREFEELLDELRVAYGEHPDVDDY